MPRKDVTSAGPSVNTGPPNGRDSDEDSDEWDEGDLQPMSEDHKGTLRSHRDQLIELVNPGEVLIRLEASGVLSKHEMQEINKDKNSRHDKNEILLDHLLIKADSAFDKFLEALTMSNQIHIACLLSPGYHKKHSLTPKKKTPVGKKRSSKKSLNTVSSPQSGISSASTGSPAKPGTSDDLDGLNSDGESVDKGGVPVQVKLGIDQITQQHSRTTRNSVKLKKELLESAIYDNLVLYRRKQQQLKKIANRRVTQENSTREKDIQNSMKFLLEQNEILQNQLEDLNVGVFEALETHGRSLTDIDRGSILLSVRCPTLSSLEDLKQKCQGPCLKRLFEETFITDKLMEELALTKASLKINLNKNDYLQCKQSFLNKDLLSQRRKIPNLAFTEENLTTIAPKIKKIQSKPLGKRVFGEITNLSKHSKLSKPRRSVPYLAKASAAGSTTRRLRQVASPSSRPVCRL